MVDVEPFGRPFLAHLTMSMSVTDERTRITLSPVTRCGLKNWDFMKGRTRVGMDFVFNRIARRSHDTVVDVI